MNICMYFQAIHHSLLDREKYENIYYIVVTSQHFFKQMVKSVTWKAGVLFSVFIFFRWLFLIVQSSIKPCWVSMEMFRSHFEVPNIAMEITLFQWEMHIENIAHHFDTLHLHMADVLLL